MKSWLALGTVFVVSLISMPQQMAFAQADLADLERGRSVERELAEGQAHSYGVDLAADQFMFLTVEQQGIDVVVRVISPGGEELTEVDSPNGLWGVEPVALFSTTSGMYSVQVTPLGEGEIAPGNYVITLERLEPVAATRSGRVDQLFAQWDRVGSPGASVAVAHDGVLLFENGYGYAQLEYDIPITAATVFHVASVSKQFTAFAVTVLADQGKLSLDDDIRQYLPYVPDFGYTITARHLIHHMSGLRDQWNLLALAGWRLDDVITKDQVLRLVERQKELNFEPGAEYLYCNTGYTLLADIVDHVTGQPFPEWMAENVFQPLEMNGTHFHDDHEFIVPNRAYSYAEGGRRGLRKSVLSYANVGATSLFTTAEDLTKWMDNLESGEIGGPEVRDLMHTRGILNDGDTLGYAFGLSLGTYRGSQTVGHGGADAGFRSNVMRFPERGYAIAVLSNLASFNAGGMAQRVADIYLEDDLEPVAPELEAEVADTEEAVVVDPSVFDDYVGDYELEVGINLTVTRDGDQLMVQPTGQPAAALQPQSDTTFLATQVNALVIFHRDGPGKVSRMTVEQGGQSVGGKRVDVIELTTELLAEYEGSYHSEELGTSYKVVVTDTGLVARHVRHDPITLVPAARDNFAGNTWFFAQLKFERDEAGAIIGMRVSSGRVRNLLFVKVEG